MAWRWLRHVKNDNLDYTFAVPAQTFTYQQGFISFGVGAEKGVDPTAYAEGNAAITFTSSQEGIVNLVANPQSLITFPGKGAGAAVQWEFGSGFPWYFSFKTWAIRNYTNRTNITGAAATLSMNQSSGEFYARNVGIYLCAIINDETEELYIGIITQQQYLRFDDINNRYSRSNQTVYMCCAYDSNVYNILASSESGGGGGGGNPYEGGGLNDEPAGGEDQNFEETSDTIAEPVMPLYTATGSGFVTAYVPTIGQINSIADYLIDPNILQAIGGTVLKLSDVVIGLSIFPFVVPAANNKVIKINFMGLRLETGVTSYYADDQFVALDMGSLDIKKYWDNCLDYDPFTSISLYLPYVGYVDLDTDEVMGKTIQIKYNVDIFTGCCLALIIVDGSVMYQFPGECSCQIPVTSVSFDSFMQSAISLGIAAAGGAEAIKGGQALVDNATDNFMKASGRKQIFKAQEKMFEAEAGLDAIKTKSHEQLGLAGVSAVMSAKGQYSHAGAMSSCAGILGTQKPFLTIKRPKQCMPEGYESIRGFPCNMKKALGDLEGYTEVGDIHLNIPDATVEEIVECERFLKGGVFL